MTSGRTETCKGWQIAELPALLFAQRVPMEQSKSNAKKPVATISLRYPRYHMTAGVPP